MLLVYIVITPAALKSMGFVMGWVQYDTAEFINSPREREFIIDLSFISSVKFSP